MWQYAGIFPGPTFRRYSLFPLDLVKKIKLHWFTSFWSNCLIRGDRKADLEWAQRNWGESLSYQVDNLSGNLRISSDAVIADFVDKQNSFLPSQFFPLVYIVTSLGRCSQLNYKLLNPTKLVIHILSFILSVLLIVSAFFFPDFFFSQT